MWKQQYAIIGKKYILIGYFLSMNYKRKKFNGIIKFETAVL